MPASCIEYAGAAATVGAAGADGAAEAATGIASATTGASKADIHSRRIATLRPLRGNLKPR
jgi:hypothetical protein